MYQAIPGGLRHATRQMFASSALRFCSGAFGGAISALLYHRVTPEALRTDESAFLPNIELSVQRDRFEEQMRLVSKRFRCVSLDQAISELRDGRVPPRTLVVTFDDGYRDNLTCALPILERYKVPATIYVTTGVVERTAELWWYAQGEIFKRLDAVEFFANNIHYHWPLSSAAEKKRAFIECNAIFKTLTPAKQHEIMREISARASVKYSYEEDALSWPEVQKLGRHPLITIGAHTVSHPSLSTLSDAELGMELIDSKRILEAQIQKEVRHFSYPFGERGQASQREFRAAIECGYVSAATTRYGHIFLEHADHLAALPRVFVNYFDNLEAFKWKLSGLESYLHYKKVAVITD